MSDEVWQYRGQKVHVPSTADIPYLYRQHSPLAYIVQQAIDSVETWKEGATPTYTNGHADMILSVVPIDGREVIWAKHRGHKARQVQVSPFVTVKSRWPVTASFTLELAGTADQPWLVRAYPGEYIPPLPWQNSAKNAVGGVDACIAFWQQHAYIYSDGAVQPFSRAQEPDWFGAKVQVS